MKQQRLYEIVRHVIENHASDANVKAMDEEIIFMESRYGRYLIVSDRRDTCYPLKFYINERKWGFESRSLRTIDDDSIYGGYESYDAISFEKAKTIIGDNLPDEMVLEELENYKNKQNRFFSAKEWKPATKIKETRTPSGEMVSINEDGSESTQPLGEEIVTIYECPCGEGTIEATFENMPGYRDSYAFIQCDKCRKNYKAYYNWARDRVPVLKNMKDIE